MKDKKEFNSFKGSTLLGWVTATKLSSMSPELLGQELGRLAQNLDSGSYNEELARRVRDAEIHLVEKAVYEAAGLPDPQPADSRRELLDFLQAAYLTAGVSRTRDTARRHVLEIEMLSLGLLPPGVPVPPESPAPVPKVSVTREMVAHLDRETLEKALGTELKAPDGDFAAAFSAEVRSREDDLRAIVTNRIARKPNPTGGRQDDISETLQRAYQVAGVAADAGAARSKVFEVLVDAGFGDRDASRGFKRPSVLDPVPTIPELRSR